MGDWRPFIIICSHKMGSMESLYKVCTYLGTLIFILLFLNYYLEAKGEVSSSEEEVSNDTDTNKKRTSKKGTKTPKK